MTMAHSKLLNKINRKVIRKYPILIRVLIGCSIVGIIIWKLDFSETLRLIHHLRFSLFLLGIVLSFMKLFVEVYKVFLLLHFQKISISYFRVFKIMTIGTFLGTFAPTSLGMEAFRIYGFSKFTNKTLRCILAVGLNRFLGLLVLLVLASVSLFWERNYIQDVGAFWIILIFVLLVFMLIFPWMGRSLNRWFPLPPKSNFMRKIWCFILDWDDNIHASMRLFKGRGLFLLFLIILTFIFQGLRILAVYFISLSLGLHLNVLYFFIITPLILLFMMVPLSIGGIGTREVSAVYFLGKMGVPAEHAFSVSILWFLAAIISSMPGAFYYLKEGMKVRRATGD